MTMTNLDIVIYGTTTLRITTFSKAFKKRDIHTRLSIMALHTKSYAECCYAEYRYAGFHWALFIYPYHNHCQIFATNYGHFCNPTPHPAPSSPSYVMKLFYGMIS